MRIKLINICIIVFIVITSSVLVYILINILFIFIRAESISIAINILSDESYTYKGGSVSVGMKYLQGIVWGTALLIGLIKLLIRKE